MKTIIHEIGVLDKSGNIHKVRLQEGLNIITGKSSTGKSAMIEIFDYCFNGKYTIPKGVITDNAEIYYLYLQIEENFIVIGREKDDGKCFFKRENEYKENLVSSKYFESSNFLSRENYRKQLIKLFIDISDIDKSLIEKDLRRKAAPTPSVRSFMSFILQHQNLVANKHALFYRFDEKEKREQVIEHTKIFLGFVDQNYFILSQQKEQLQYVLNKLMRDKKAIDNYIAKYYESIEIQLMLIYSLMGIEEPYIVNFDDIKINAQDSKLKLDNFIGYDNIKEISNKESDFYKDLITEIDAYDSRRRELSFKFVSIQNYLERERKVSEDLSSLEHFDKVEIGVSVCPFCLSEKNSLTEQAENLKQAMQKLSKDLILNRSLKSHLEVDLQKIKDEIKELDIKIKEKRKLKKQLEQKDKNILRIKSRYEQILEFKAKLFSTLDLLSQNQSNSDESKIDKLKSELKDLEEKLKDFNYDKNNRSYKQNQ